MRNDEVIQELWKLCNILRDEGISYTNYLDEVSYMLCIKLLKEDGMLYAEDVWDELMESVRKVGGKEIIREYNRALGKMEAVHDEGIRNFFESARSKISTHRLLQMLLEEIDALDWNDREKIIAFYEGIMMKSCYTKEGGQYITPSVLSRVLIELIAPKQWEECHDPACGSYRFMVDAYEYVCRKNFLYDKRVQREISFNFSGTELNRQVFRMAVMNALLHHMPADRIWRGNAFEEEKVLHANKKYDVIIADPPLGGQLTIDRYRWCEWRAVPTSNNALNFLQYIYNSLKVREDEGARACAIVPDSILFGEGAELEVRQNLMYKCKLHTVLRLPSGILFPYSGVKINVLFFNRGEEMKENTEEVYFYDMRTDMPKFGTTNQIKYEHFEKFIHAYQAKYRKQVQDEHWTCYSREEIRQRGDSLDLGLHEKKIDLSLEKEIDLCESGEKIALYLEEAAALVKSVIRGL